MKNVLKYQHDAIIYLRLRDVSFQYREDTKRKTLSRRN